MVDAKSEIMGTLLFHDPRSLKKFVSWSSSWSWSWSSSSRIAGTLVVYNSFCFKSISLRWHQRCSTWLSSSNQMNLWIMFELSNSTMVSWSGKCGSIHLSFTYALGRWILDTLQSRLKYLSIPDRIFLFLHSHNDVVFTWIYYLVSITLSRMVDGIFTSFKL